MRRITWVLVLAGTLGAAEENLLRPGRWATMSASGQGRFETVKGKKRGSKALQVTRPKAFGQPENAWREFVLPRTKRDGQLKVSALVAGRKLGNAWLRCILADDAGQNLSTTDLNGATALNGDFKWKKVEQVIDIPVGASKGRILLNVYAGEVVKVDDVRVVHVPPKGANKRQGLRLKNGTFDRNKSGWRKLLAPAHTVRVAVDRKVVAAGKGSLRLERKGPRLLPQEGVAADVADVGRVRRITLHFSARAEPGARAVVSLLVYNKHGSFLAAARAVVTAPDFAAGKVDLKLPPHARALTVALAIEGAGRVWFDELALEGK